MAAPLEALLTDVTTAVFAACRMARRYVMVTVPSEEDDTPEHVHLLAYSTG